MALSALLSTGDDDGGPVLARRKLPTDCALDMTPMIDVTFLLLIFFLVSSVPDVQAALDLPRADHGIGVSRREALIISVAYDPAAKNVSVFLGDGKNGVAVATGRAAQEAAVRAAAQEAVGRGIEQVIVKAERQVRYADVSRLVRAASLPGLSVSLAVREGQ